MKKFLNIIAIAIMAISFSSQAFAQNNTEKNMSREQFAQSQAKRIAKGVGLDSKQTAKYIETYMAYQKELWALGSRTKAKDGSSAEENMKARFERSQQILSLREKYYAKYSEFMTQNQIEKSYRLEHDAMERMSQQHQKSR